MPIGARIRASFPRPSADLVARFAGLAVCDVADATGRLYLADPAISPVGGGERLVGTALPVLCRPDDNLMIHAAIDRAQPGDVLVVAAGGGTAFALVGELVSLWAKYRGVAGFVLDGAARDVESLALPVFARGRSARQPHKAAPGEVGYAVGLGGVRVEPGDIIVADADGVAVVPQADAEAVLERVAQLAAKDAAAKAHMAAGTFDRTWVAAALKAAGVEEEEAP
ncbi:MAG TPA: RraA family protein [Symbiobacteriaceae bacterium]|nr:RraA family protein [Symbiobacteriaceae bacterium]